VYLTLVYHDLTILRSFAVGPTQVKTVFEALVMRERDKNRGLQGTDIHETHLIPFKTRLLALRAVSLSILTYSCASPFPLLLEDDIRRPDHLRRHPALESMLHSAKEILDFHGNEVDDIDSVDAFLRVLPKHDLNDRLFALKILVLGLCATSPMTWGGKTLLSRAIKVSNLHATKRISFDTVSKNFFDGVLTIEHVQDSLKFLEENSHDDGDKKEQDLKHRRRPLFRRRKRYNIDSRQELMREDYCLTTGEFLKAILLL